MFVAESCGARRSTSTRPKPTSARGSEHTLHLPSASIPTTPSATTPGTVPSPSTEWRPAHPRPRPSACSRSPETEHPTAEAPQRRWRGSANHAATVWVDTADHGDGRGTDPPFRHAAGGYGGPPSSLADGASPAGRLRLDGALHRSTRQLDYPRRRVGRARLRP